MQIKSKAAKTFLEAPYCHSLVVIRDLIQHIWETVEKGIPSQRTPEELACVSWLPVTVGNT